MKSFARLGVAVAGLALFGSLTACNVPQIGSNGVPKSAHSIHSPHTPVKSTSSAVSEPSASPTQTKKAVASFIFNAGFVTRTQPVGTSQFIVKYYTSQDPAEWAYSDSVPVHLSALVNESGDGDVHITGFHVTLACGNRLLDLRDQSGDFTIKSPQSFDSVFMVQCPIDVDQATLNIEYDLKFETYLNSGEYTSKTVLDTLVLDFPGDQS